MCIVISIKKYREKYYTEGKMKGKALKMRMKTAKETPGTGGTKLERENAKERSEKAVEQKFDIISEEHC